MLGVLAQAKKTWPAHSGNAKANVSERCLVAVKMYGTKPKKLFSQIKIKTVILKKRAPGGFRAPIMAENSLFSIFVLSDRTKLIWENPAQKRLGHKRIKTKKEESQFHLHPNQLVGSKIEKRLDIKM